MPFSMDPQIGESACTELSEWEAAFPFSPSSRFTPCIFIPISLYKYILHCFFYKADRTTFHFYRMCYTDDQTS